MRELVYGGVRVEKLIKKKYPSAKIRDASDYVHPERFEVEIEGIPEEEFYRFAIRSGFAKLCFIFRCKLMMGDKTVKRWIKGNRIEGGMD